MEAVLHNLESTMELLGVSQSDMVAEWDSETVDRAFQWAHYCEQLHTRFHTNPSVRAALQSRIHDTNQRLAHAFSGYRCVTLSDVAQCRYRLFHGLLKNPATPHPVIKILLSKFVVAEDDNDQCVGFRSACKLLRDFEPSNRKCDIGFSVGTRVHSMMLLERIQVLQNRPGNQTYAANLLDHLLENVGKGQDSFLTLIAVALQSTDTMTEDTTAQEFLLDWLKEQDDFLHSMCQTLPPELCTRLSQRWPKFRLAYWDSLKKSSSFLEYDVSKGLWVQPCDSTASFRTLVDRFQSLWNSALRNETEELLLALKQADGDFDVEGLSVWTDMLGQLK